MGLVLQRSATAAVGFALLFSPLWSLFGRPIAYQALATALQTGSLIALWVLVRSLGFPARVSFLAVVAAGTSGFVYYHSIYPWPKLLAATFVLAAMVPLLRAFFRKERLTPVAASIAAAATALAMLTHSGAIFTLLPLALMLALRAGAIVSLRAAALAVAIMAALYAPWLAYARFIDPNNDKLLKLHLTDGSVKSPNRSAACWRAPTAISPSVGGCPTGWRTSKRNSASRISTR